jgi:photosystem II stability/assembly factor-like uncharacterized protein
MNSPRLANLVFSFVLVVAVSLGGIAGGAAASEFSLYKSTNLGTTWVPVGRGLPAEARINALEVAGTIAVAGTERGVFISRDAGMNWQPATRGVGTEARVLCLTVQSGHIFAGTHQHGVLVSGDGGATWQTVNHGLTDRYVRSLLAVGTNLYAGTDREGVFVSTDAGATWTNQRAGLPESSQVFDLALLGETVFAGLYSKGLYRWSAESGLWLRAGEVAPLELVATGKTLVVGHNPGGVFVSEDHGKTWQDGGAGLPVHAPIWTLAAGEERVFVGTTGKLGLGAEDVSLFASKDKGKSWSRSDTGLPDASAAVSFVVTKEFILVGIISPKPKSGAAAP